MLTIYDQTTFSDAAAGTHGDCFRATVCTLLQIAPATLPHPILAGGGWNGAFHKALRELGWVARTMDYDEAMARHPDLKTDRGWPIPRVVLAAGLSERDVRHSVVWDRIAARMIHDPHPSRAGLLDIDAIDFLMPVSALYSGEVE